MILLWLIPLHVTTVILSPLSFVLIISTFIFIVIVHTENIGLVKKALWDRYVKPFLNMFYFEIIPSSMHVCSVMSDSLWLHGLYSPPGSSVHGIFQASRLEWVAISASRGSSWNRDRTFVSCVSCIGRQIFFFFLTTEPPGKPYLHLALPSDDISYN